MTHPLAPLLEQLANGTARLLHIVESNQAAGRPKDQLFLATHKDALEQLLKRLEHPPDAYHVNCTATLPVAPFNRSSSASVAPLTR